MRSNFTVEYPPDYWLETDFSPESGWVCNIRGWIPKSFVNEPASGGLQVKIKRRKHAEEYVDQASGQGVPDSAISRPHDFYFLGEAKPLEEHVSTLARIYFSGL